MRDEAPAWRVDEAGPAVPDNTGTTRLRRAGRPRGFRVLTRRSVGDGTSGLRAPCARPGHGGVAARARSARPRRGTAPHDPPDRADGPARPARHVAAPPQPRARPHGSPHLALRSDRRRAQQLTARSPPPTSVRPDEEATLMSQTPAETCRENRPRPSLHRYEL